MLKALFSLLLIAGIFICKAHPLSDTLKNNIPRADGIYMAVDVVPEFPGGLGEFGRFLAHNIRYPARAREQKISGRVFAGFVVETDGSLSNIKILRGLGSGCDEEVIRVLSQSPRWSPGLQNGRAVRVQYNMPVGFSLTDDHSVAESKPPVIDLPEKNTLVQYYKYPDRLVDEKESADYISFIYPPDNSAKRLHPFKEFYANGKIKLNGYVNKRNGRLFMEGPCVEYYPQGTKRLSVTYDDNGKRTGSEYLFYPNGKLHSERKHDPDNIRVQIRFIACRDSLGTSLTQDGNGEWVEYDGDFNKVKLSGPVKDGIPNGDWAFWENGNTKMVKTYVKGALKSETLYYKAEDKFITVNEFPMYKGSYKELNKYLRKNIKCTKKADGVLVVAVTVMPDGTFANIRIKKPLGYDCDEAAVKVIRSTEPWVPNKTLRKPLEVLIPINFGGRGYNDGFDYPPTLSAE
ncbi:MAG: TonB family protein [Sphingobacteriaceae bacterium]|nr:MAG: TonB family protein [Sphingobacteriaceae bacterium]